MATRRNTSVVRFMSRFITLFISFSQTISSQPPAEVKSLIYSLQNKYCGRQFCTSDLSQEPPFCNEESIQAIKIDPVTNLTIHTVASPQRKRQGIPPCSKCSCSDSCSLYGDCCADKLIGREYYFDCQEINQHVSSGYNKLFSHVVTKCLPDAPNYSKDIAENCEYGELGYIPDGRLVTVPHPDYSTSVTFRNKYCAMCYNITNYTPWDVYISCNEDFDSSNHTDINSLIRLVTETNGCTVSTDHPDAGQSIICQQYNGMISTCNVTGKWDEYNDTLETACHFYLNPTLGYRNIFCALCNEISEENLMCPTGDRQIPNLPPIFLPFSAILNFDKSDMEVINGRSSSYPVTRIGKQEEDQCRTGDVFDDISKKCREVYCPLGISPRNTTCTKLVPTETYVVTTWMLTAYYTDALTIPFGAFSSNFGGSVIDALKESLADWGFTLYSSFPSDFASIHSIHSLVVKESQLEVGLLLLPQARLEMSRQKLVDIKNFTLNITWLGETKSVHVVPNSSPRNVTDMLKLPTFQSLNAPLEFQDIDFSKTISVPLGFNVSCPLLRFESHNVLSVNKLVVIHGNNVLEEDNYFVKDKDNYFLCVDAVFQPQILDSVINEPTKTTDEFRMEQIVTVICFSCSLIFLMLTMLVYVLIRQLHTVPGMNLILLAFSLFVAQTLYFFGAGAGSVTTATVCTVIGVLIHYFWLVAFAWMIVCSVHMVRVFSSLFSSLDFADDKKCVLLKYSAFAFGAPLVIVGVTISTSYITSGYTSIGYGGSTLCFSASGFTSILSFGVPAGVTVMTNTILLIYAMVHIRRAKNGLGGKDTGGTSDIIKFFKLSTITGLSWLFGFLGYFFQRVELLYVFTVLTAGQGVFIFLSFVVSRRILKLLSDRFDCLRGKADFMKRSDENTSSRGRTFSQFMSSRRI